MDGHSPPPEPKVSPDNGSEAPSDPSCDSAVTSGNLKTSTLVVSSFGRDSAVATGIDTSPKQDEECPMDTSEEAVTGPSDEPMLFKSSTTSVSEKAELPSSSHQRSSSVSSDTAVTTAASRLRKYRSDQHLPHSSDNGAVASMTASLQQLAVTPTASPSPPATKAPKATACPPAKAKRSASGRRQPPPQQDRSDRKRRTRQPKASDAPTSSSRPLSSSRGNASSSRSGRGRVSKRLLRQVPREQPPQVNTPQLPRSTPDGFTHYSIDSHPWARYVNPRPVRMLRDRTPRVISELDRDSYRQLPDSGYMSLGFNRSLFPQVTLREDRPPAEITFIELPHLEDAVLFREQSKRVIDDLLAGTYQDVEVAEMDPTPLGNNPSTIVPPLMDGCSRTLSSGGNRSGRKRSIGS
ncbi:hypothetical protein GCK32_000946 [Trichostrongylus colubriformis]|uniref:Uncharacterized protein n=1 Tax=Trichostrongylus colubriformis TaxID=6319 RepID=A0AAN8J2H7_TRICO